MRSCGEKRETFNRMQGTEEGRRALAPLSQGRSGKARGERRAWEAAPKRLSWNTRRCLLDCGLRFLGQKAALTESNINSKIEIKRADHQGHRMFSVKLIIIGKL